MNESPFGTAQQLWPALPFPGFGYFQIPSTTRPIVSGQSAPDFGPPAAPLFAAADFGTIVTPQALLAAIGRRRGQPMGPTNDQEIEDFIIDALDMLPGASDVDVRCESGRATLTGTVSHKRVKRDAGEIVWAIPNVHDVQNNITIATRRRSRSAGREQETHAVPGGGRKQ